MDKAKDAPDPVAAMEEATDQSQEDDPTRDRQGKSLSLGVQWPGTLVECRGVTYERRGSRQMAPTSGIHEPSGGTPTPEWSCMNRRMPNGTYGGVGGWGP